jgi:hypothetical protein
MALMGSWLGLALLWRAMSLRRARRRQGLLLAAVEPAPPPPIPAEAPVTTDRSASV